MDIKKSLMHDRELLYRMQDDLDEYLETFHSRWTEFELENADSKIELAKTALLNAQEHLNMARRQLNNIELK